MQLQTSNNDLVNEKTELETARQEIEGHLQQVVEKLQRMEQQLRANDEKGASIKIRRGQVLEGMSAEDAFELGISMEREVKRRKLD